MVNKYIFNNYKEADEFIREKCKSLDYIPYVDTVMVMDKMKDENGYWPCSSKIIVELKKRTKDCFCEKQVHALQSLLNGEITSQQLNVPCSC